MSDVEILEQEDVEITAEADDEVEVTLDEELTIIEVPEQGPQGERGEQGVHGIDGRVILYGVSPPSDTDGFDGDFYITTSSHLLYGPKAGGTWPTGVSLIGPEGDKGDTGDTGATGQRGAIWFAGAGAPGTQGGQLNGDYYLNTVNGDVYTLGSGTWSLVGNIEGPQGDTGAAGPSLGESSNMALNPKMSISQENGTSWVTLSTTVAKYIVDGWIAAFQHSTGAVRAAQAAVSSMPGYDTALALDVTTGLSTPANDDYCCFLHKIEGTRAAMLGWGAAGALDLSYGLTLQSSAGGVAMLRFSNPAANRAYHREITIPAGGTHFYSGTIPGDTTGTWPTDTGAGIHVTLFVCGKSASPATPDAWSATPALQSTNSGNLVSSAVTIYLTGIYLVAGSLTPAEEDVPRLMPSIGHVQADCMRYVESVSMPSVGLAGYCPSASIFRTGIQFKVIKRAAPTVLVGTYGSMSVNTVGGNNTATSISLNAADVNAAAFELGVAGTPFTAGQGGAATVPAGTLIFAARL